MKYLRNNATRMLLVSLLFLGSAILFTINFGLFGASGLSAIELGLYVTAIVTWGIAAIQSLVLRSVDKNRDLTQDSDQPIANQGVVIKRSTHAMINASLHTISSSCFIAGGCMTPATTPNVLGISGSALWLGSALGYGWLAWAHDRKKEKNPLIEIKPLHIHPSVYHFLFETAYLAAGGLFAAKIWTEPTFYPLKAAGNIQWLLASTHEVIRTGIAMAKQDEAIELPAPAMGGA